jgi:hypothetical protein
VQDFYFPSAFPAFRTSSWERRFKRTLTLAAEEEGITKLANKSGLGPMEVCDVVEKYWHSIEIDNQSAVSELPGNQSICGRPFQL